MFPAPGRHMEGKRMKLLACLAARPLDMSRPNSEDPVEKFHIFFMGINPPEDILGKIFRSKRNPLPDGVRRIEFDEAILNSFEYVITDTEQVQTDQKESRIEPRVSTLDAAAERILQGEIPTQVPVISETVKLDPDSPPPFELTFSCLMIPRFSDHYLTGDITGDLSDWVRQICISYGWRLDDILIRPGHLQWVMTVPPTESPVQFMRIMRKLTSQKIFEYYPRYSRLNLSGEFWAPGFSVVPGRQLQSLESVNAFILQIRRQQGIY